MDDQPQDDSSTSSSTYSSACSTPTSNRSAASTAPSTPPSSAPPTPTQKSAPQPTQAQSTQVSLPSTSISTPISTCTTTTTTTSTTQSAITPASSTVKIHNVVSTFNMGCLLTLSTIAQHARNTHYNPKRFAACIVRIRDPPTTALIFSNGQTVVVGAKTIDLSKLAARKFARMVQKLGYATKFENFQIRNMVATGHVCDPADYLIRLEGLAAKYMMFCRYEPEVFAGCVWRMVEPKVVLLIFPNGKVVVTGAKSVGEVERAFERIYAFCWEFRVENPEVRKGIIREKMRRDEVRRLKKLGGRLS